MKKNALFFSTGPPSVPPYWLNVPMGCCAVEKKFRAFHPLVLTAVERRAVKDVGARAADHVDLAAGHAAVLRRQHALDDLHFGDRVEAHHRDLILAAVLRERARLGIRVRLGAVHRQAGAASRDAVHLHHAVAADVDAGGQAHQVREVAAIDRQFAHLLRSEAVSLQRSGRLDERRFSGNGHRFRQRADFERERLAHRLARAQLHALVLQRLESGQLDLHGVRAGRQRREDELAVRVAHAFARRRRCLRASRRPSRQE